VKKQKEISKNIEKFNYFDDNFYGFLTTTSRGSSTKKIRFKSKETKIFTPKDAFIVKSYIDNNDLKYKNLDIKRLLSNSSIIQKIINAIQKSAIL
jgi:hypothetical protein